MKKRITCFLLALLMVLSILPPQTFAVNVETDSGKHPMMDKTVSLKSDASIFQNAIEDPYSSIYGTGVGKSAYPAYMVVEDVAVISNVTYYKLKAHPCNAWPDYFGSYYEHTWLIASELVESVAPCGCCESCTNAEGCQCQCGQCAFCEKPTDPSNPSDPSAPTVPEGDCPVCGESGCTTQHKQCDICEDYDCIKIHLWCTYCGDYDCGVSHAFCSACGKYECGETHVYCRFCKTYDCGRRHDDPYAPSTAPVIPANPTLPEGEGVFLLDANGNVVSTDGLTLYPGTKISVSAWPSGDAENVTYKWQICYDNAGSRWVDIYGQNSQGILVGASMVKNMVDSSGLTYLRCVTNDGTQTRASDSIPVRLMEEQKASGSASSSNSEASSNDENQTRATDEVTYAVTIRYEVKHSGVEAPQPKVYNLKAGDNYILDVTHPTMPGYYPGNGAGEAVPQTTMTIVDIKAPIDIVIYYWPDFVDFVVNHYEQNVGDDNYTLRDTDIISDKKTGEAVGADLGNDYTGFDRLPYDSTITVAADGSTVINIYYDRQYFMLSLDLKGGYGAEPIYARYGTPVSIPNPKRTGYTFVGWSPAIPGEVREKTEHEAQWKNASTTFTVAFWYENANDTDYTFVGSAQQSGITDGIVNGSDYAKLNDLSNALHFDGFEADYAKHFTTLNADKTDKNVKIKADGTTVVNVYFYRNTYQLTYYEFVCQHQTHSSSCYTTTLTCGMVQHTHSHDECCSWFTSIHIHGYSACPYKEKNGGPNGSNGEHTHVDSCYTTTLTCDHATSKSYFNCACITNDAHNNIQKNFANWKILYQGKHKFEENVGHIHQQMEGTEGYRWVDHMLGGQMKEPYGDGGAVGSFTAMPGGETIFCRSGNGSSPFRMIYWLETTDGNGSRTYNGKNFAKGATFFNKMSFVAWSGDYVEGTPRGFEPFDATFGDADNSSSKTDTFTEKLSTSENNRSYKEWNNFYYIRKTYDLEYFNGETRVATRSMKFEESLTSAYNLQNLTMTSPYGPGYEFGGWYLDPECTIPVKFDGSERMPDGGMAVYAKWSPITHTVKTYQSKEAIGGTPINTYGISHGEKYEGTVAIPKGEAGMNFIGWFYEEDGKENAYDFSMPVYRDMNLYAKWNSGTSVTGKIYYVDENGNSLYYVNGVPSWTDITGLVGDTKTYSAKLSSELGDGNTLYLPHVTSHNIKFSGNASQNTFTFVYKAMPEVGYTIKFVNKDNPSHELFPAITGKSNSPTLFYDAMAEGKIVEKYYLDKNSKTFVLSFDESLNVFYFYYTYDPGKATVQVQHYIENADGTGYDFHSETLSTVEELGTIIKAIDRKVTINGFTYHHATFNDKEKTETVLDGGLTIKLYYTRNSYRYTFRFVYKDSQGNEVEFPNSAITGTAKYNTSIRQNAKAFPGYTTSSKAQSLVVFYQESSNVRTFVYEEEDATIRYQVGAVKGGTVSVSSETLKAVSGTATGSTAAVSNSNYRFVGWFTNYAGTGTPVSTSLSFVPDKNSDNVYEDITYYALFEEIKVDIRYAVQMPAGAAVTATLTKTSEQVDVVTGIAKGIAVDTVPNGYRFEGWYDANGNKLSSNTSFTPTRPEDGWVDETTFTAKFVEKQATISYVVVGDVPGSVASTSEKVNMVTGTAVGTTAETAENYSMFVGWYSDEACTKLVTKDKTFAPEMPDGGWEETQTYYARFEWIKYLITFKDRGQTVGEQAYKATDTLKLPTVTNGNYRLTWTLKDTTGNWNAAGALEEILAGEPIYCYGNVTLVANWDIDVYWVDESFDFAKPETYAAVLEIDENVPFGTQHTYDGQQPTKAPTLEYTYSFDRWVEEDLSALGDLAKGIMVYRASYKENVILYTMTFKLENGQQDIVLSQRYGSAIEVPADPTWEGYSFKGWDAQIPATMPAGNTTFTAQWEINKYKVEYQLGLTAERLTNADAFKTVQVKTHGTDLTLYTTVPGALGVEFLGWDANKDGKVDYAAGANFTANEDTVLVAVWEPTPMQINYQTVGLLGEFRPSFESQAGLYGDQFKVQAPNVTGYTIDKIEVDDVKVNDAYMITLSDDDVSVVITYKPNRYTIKFDANEGSGKMGDLDMTYDVSKSLTANTFTRTGYKFIGWNTQNDGKGTAYVDKASVENLTATANGVVTLYAQWQAQYSYKLVFDANKPAEATGTVTGMPGTQTQSWCDDTSKTFTWSEVPSLTNYTFKGWSTDKNATSGDAAKEYEITGIGAQEASVTLYAIWTLDVADYTVEIYLEKVDSDEYEVTKDTPKSGTIGTEATVSANDYLKEGFVFDAEKSVVSGEVKADGSLVLKVYYNRIRYTVTGTLNDDEIFKETVKHGASSSAITFTPANQFAINSIKVNDEDVAVTDENKYGYTYKALSNVTEDVTVAVTSVRVKANLTISVTGSIGDQSFVFIVKDSNDAEVARVALYPGKTSQTIIDLPLGDYTVTPAFGWTWRQNLGAQIVAVDGLEDSVEFTWSAVDTFIYWLNGYGSNKIQVNSTKRKK